MKDDEGNLCTKCGENPALDNETNTCKTCEDRALDALMVMAVRRLGPLFTDEDTELTKR